MTQPFKQEVLEDFRDSVTNPTELMKLLELNPAANLPYHNNDHAYAVAHYAYLIGKKEGLPVEQLRTLLAAGLFHDYGHRAYATEDVNNILTATTFVENHKQEFSDLHIDPYAVTLLITATMSNTPTISKTTPLTLPEEVIRDADLAHWVEPEGRQERLDGLAEELGVPVTLDSTKQYLQKADIRTNAARRLLTESGLLEK